MFPAPVKVFRKLPPIVLLSTKVPASDWICEAAAKVIAPPKVLLPVMLRRAPLALMPVPLMVSASAPMLMLPPALLVVSSKAVPSWITVPPAVVPKPALLPTRTAPAVFVRIPIKVLVPLRKRVEAPDLVMLVPSMTPLRMMLLDAVLMSAVVSSMFNPISKVCTLVDRLVRIPGLPFPSKNIALPRKTNAPAPALNTM